MATVTKSQVTQKLPSTASAQDFSKMKTGRKDDDYSAPISEMDNEGDEAEVDDEPDDMQEQSRISNINSMDPV